MIEKANKVLSGIKYAMVCDHTIEDCCYCPYEKECDNHNLTEIPRNLLMDMGQIAQAYWETLQPGYKTNAEIELEKIVGEYKDRLTRFAHLTYIHVGTEDKWICSNCDNPIFFSVYSYCPHCGARFV